MRGDGLSLAAHTWRSPVLSSVGCALTIKGHKSIKSISGSDEAGGGQPCTGQRLWGWVAYRSLLPTASRGCFKRPRAFVRWSCVHIGCRSLCRRLPGELVASQAFCVQTFTYMVIGRSVLPCCCKHILYSMCLKTEEVVVQPPPTDKMRNKQSVQGRPP